MIAIYKPLTLIESEFLQHYAFAYGFRWLDGGKETKHLNRTLVFNREKGEITISSVRCVPLGSTFMENVTDIMHYIKNESAPTKNINLRKLEAFRDGSILIRDSDVTLSDSLLPEEFDQFVKDRDTLLLLNRIEVKEDVSIAAEPALVPYVSFYYPDKNGEDQYRKVHLAILKESGDYIEGYALKPGTNRYSYKKFSLNKISDIFYDRSIDPDTLYTTK